ncbi:MAG TPA: DUF1648 domain-containing protein [Syntrophomonadaceae bacterium]|nr:DUF1648 domain-containing protein [Syntrophomonadaceae bacterium]
MLAINILIVLFASGFNVLNMFLSSEVLFGVRIPSQERLTSEVKEIRKGFLVGIAGITIIMLILACVQFRLYPQWSLMFSIYGPLIIVLMFLFIYFRSWKRAKELKEKNNWITPGKGYSHSPVSEWKAKESKLPMVVNIPTLVIIIVLFILTFSLYHQLPASVPIHFDANSVPDAWLDKSYWSVSLIPLILYFTWLVFVFSSYLVVKQKITINKKDPILSFAQQQVYKQHLLISLGLMNIIITLLIIPLQLIVLDLVSPSTLGVYNNNWGFTVGVFIAMLPMLIVYFRSGQGGRKLTLLPEALESIELRVIQDAPVDTEGDMLLDDDRFWKMGLFYYNPADPSSFIENRFGVGTGFNFARGWVKIITIISLVVFILLYVLLTVMFLKHGL